MNKTASDKISDILLLHAQFLFIDQNLKIKFLIDLNIFITVVYYIIYIIEKGISENPIVFRNNGTPIFDFV